MDERDVVCIANREGCILASGNGRPRRSDGWVDVTPIRPNDDVAAVLEPEVDIRAPRAGATTYAVRGGEHPFRRDEGRGARFKTHEVRSRRTRRYRVVDAIEDCRLARAARVIARFSRATDERRSHRDQRGISPQWGRANIIMTNPPLLTR